MHSGAARPHCVGTYICAAAITRSQIVLENPPEGELKAFLEVYRKMGGQYKGNSGKLLVNGKNVQSPVKLLETGVYPGFPTDLQSPVMAVLSTIEGESCIREMVFEDRYKAADQLRKMGARIRVQGNEAVICGVKTFTWSSCAGAGIKRRCVPDPGSTWG